MGVDGRKGGMEGVRGKGWKGQPRHKACLIRDFSKLLSTPELASCYGIA